MARDPFAAQVDGLGLDPRILEVLKELGIESFTEPQVQAIPPILAGSNILLVAPTGIGKTEAALLPILHRILAEKPPAVSCLYLTPLRALNRDMLRRMSFFAERLGVRAVLINPAITPYVGLEAYLGTQKNLYTGETYELTRADLEGWRALAVERPDPERYLLLLETGDEVLDWREAARKYEGARTVIRDGGDHTMQSFAEHLPRILAFAEIAVS